MESSFRTALVVLLLSASMTATGCELVSAYTEKVKHEGELASARAKEANASANEHNARAELTRAQAEWEGRKFWLCLAGIAGATLVTAMAVRGDRRAD
ncbi:hypothetical protein L6V77_29340 [Myxococcota bacterium]|nr:hypothetical protein [Myxococcota bacterium]